MARVPVHRQIGNMVSHLAQIPVGAGVRIRPKLSKPLPPGVERLFLDANPPQKSRGFGLRLSQPRGTSWNQRFSLRRSKPASPRTPEPNSAKLLGSGVEAGTNSPDERGPSVECACPEKTWSILGLFPR